MLSRYALLFVFGALLLRALLSALVPLLPDETYYWEWTRRLQGGYFDHPPGIALLIRSGTLLLGDTKAGVRLGPAVAALVTHITATILAWQLAGRGQAGRSAAARAAALVALVPVATLGLVLATPDAALFMSAMLALFCVERALAAPVRSGASTLWWTLAGIALGVAFVSKYTAVLLPFSLVIACVAHPALRVRFREPGPWLAGAIALLLFLPVVLWNRAHDWASFRFQLGHGFDPAARGNPLTRELELVGGQLGLASPILFVLLMLASISALREGWAARASLDSTSVTARRFALAVVALVPLAFFAVSAWRRPVEANWPALIYPGAITLLATSAAPWARARAWRSGLVLAAVLLLVVTVQAWKPVLPLAPRKDPIARAHGWRSLAAAVDSARTDAFFGTDSVKWIAADRYQDASELAFHMKGQPFVFSLNLGGRTNQYDLWPTLRDQIRPNDALVVAFDADPKGDELAARVSPSFAATKRWGTFALKRGAGEVAHRTIWLFRGWRSTGSGL